MSERLSEQLALLPDYLSSHLALSLAALTIGIAICLPLAALVTRVKPLQWPTLTFASVMQTIPGIALLAFMIPLFGVGAVPAVIALWVYSIFPMLRNSYTGLRDASPDAVEAATALGMRLGRPEPIVRGDAKLPHTVCWALAGEPRGSDARTSSLRKRRTFERASTTASSPRRDAPVSASLILSTRVCR